MLLLNNFLNQKEQKKLYVVTRKYSEFHERLNSRIGLKTVPLPLTVLIQWMLSLVTDKQQGNQSWEQPWCP